ncbi:unnamed protein product [Leptidea sinapis]|uniref:DNA/RNA-binding domain-containing protein n=1 Tax=Leptidea sinapis TaxID=189913 RepID=A0A5E4Q546_9NEOP|nr:unnamed protein product [Leptidea sinapis]
MVLNAAVQILREADELKEKVLKFKNGTSMLQDRNIWTTQQELQQAYQKLLKLDLVYALEKKVEQDLWNTGFKLQIESLQSISKDRKNALRSEAQSMLAWILQAAAGFYLCLLHQICTTYKLDLPFRRRASLVGAVEGWEGSGAVVTDGRAGAAAARYACQHCLVHLGDLARYRHQLRVAHTFYRHALTVSAHSGQPYNQLALVAWRRARRLAAVYWHVRSLMVRAPFPPAPANLARTLAAAANRDTKEMTALPVLSGVEQSESKPASVTKTRLDSHTYVNELLRLLNYLHTLEHLDTAAELVTTLTSSLSLLIATDSFDTLTLNKMACVIIWIVHSSTEDLSVEPRALSDCERRAAELAASLAAATVLAVLLPAYLCDELPQRALPTLKVYLQWLTCNSKVITSEAWRSRPQVWSAFAYTFNKLVPVAALLQAEKYDTVPLPEDEELNGFLPLEGALKGLRFSNQTTWDLDLPDIEPGDGDSGTYASSSSLVGEPEIEQRVRARRILALAKLLADQHAEHITYTESEETLMFTAREMGGDELNQALQSLSLSTESVPEADSDDDDDEMTRQLPPPPIIISEADFREKVREKRVGILKPQGSLERAREERAQATTVINEQQEVPPTAVEVCGGARDAGREARKPRVNIAMAAIMRKQEEINKQVKFVTPPPTPDPTVDPVEDDKSKVVQAKPVKSLANLPIGRKTGGILSLKDKSAGYPHLVNAEPEKKLEKDDKKDKTNQTTQVHAKRQDQPTNWNVSPEHYDAQRMYQKNYGIQNTGISYNPTYQTPNNQGIRLPVVNPKEIDVRTAALQKQNSRQEMFPEGHKFTNQNYISGDKKNFLNDLPPRFANQYRYWQAAQESQNDNQFRDDSKTLLQPRQNWPENNIQQMSWWKPETQNYNTKFSQPMNVPNFYNPPPTTNTYPIFNQVPGQGVNLAQNKTENVAQNYPQPNIGQVPNIQNLVNSSHFGNTLTNFGSFNPSVSYDSTMYPQFNKFGFQPLQMKSNLVNTKDPSVGLAFGPNLMDVQQRSVNFGEPFNPEVGAMKTLDSIGGDAHSYSLFSGAPERAPPRLADHALTQQSLWSGPASPLERLLEQQKQAKQSSPPPAPTAPH